MGLHRGQRHGGKSCESSPDLSDLFIGQVAQASAHRMDVSQIGTLNVNAFKRDTGSWVFTVCTAL